MLAVDLDRQRAELAEQAGRALAPPTKARLPPSLLTVRRTINGSPGSGSMPCSSSSAIRRMTGGQFDFGRNRGRVLTRADQAGVGPCAERQAHRVEQDRLAGPGLTGQHAKARLELELEPLDEHDIVDGELPQHGEPLAPGAHFREARPPLRSAVFLAKQLERLPVPIDSG